MKTMTKRLILLVLSAALLLTCGPWFAASAEDVRLESTRIFLRTLEAKGLKYTYKGLDTDGDEQVNLSFTLSDETPLLLQVYFDSDGQSVYFRAFDLISFEEARLDEVFRLCSQLNYKYNYTRFYVDEYDTSITVSADVETRPESVGEVCYDMLAHIVLIIDDAMPALKPFAK